MSPTVTRRQLLGTMGALFLGKGCADVAAPAADGAASTDPAAAESALRLLLDSPRGELVDRLAGALNAGLSRADLVGAVLAASVSPQPLETHRRAQLYSAYQLGRMPGAESDVPLLFAALRVRDRRGSGAPRSPQTMSRVKPDDAAGELWRGLERRDVSAARDSVVALCSAGAPALAGDPLLEFGARPYSWIGHTTIDVVQTLRALELSGWYRAQPALEAMVDAVCGADQQTTGPFEASSELASTLAVGWKEGAVDQGAALELVAELRTASPEAAVDAAVALLEAGVGAVSVEEACRLASCELPLRFQWPTWIKFPMHAVTTNNALRHARHRSGTQRLRGLLLLQAVAFIPANRDMCVAHAGSGPLTGWQIDALQPAEEAPNTLDELFSQVGADRAKAVARALAWLGRGGSAAAFTAAFRDAALRNAMEEHQIKLPAAIFEEASLAAPQWQSAILATALHYGVEPTHPEWEDHAAVVAALGA